MKVQKSSARATRPAVVAMVAPATLAPRPADAPAERATYAIQGRQGITLEPYEIDDDKHKRFLTWKIQLLARDEDATGLITDVALSASYADYGTKPATGEKKSVDISAVVGGYFSIDEFRRALAALNTLAASLPETAVPEKAQAIPAAVRKAS
jgi:hypothetical protein